MDVVQPYVKVYTSACELTSSDFIKAFHAWIQQRRLDEMLIDVADYSHVHHGPGVLLVSHESYYAMDEGEGRLGMKYRKRRGDAEPAGRALRAAASAAFNACSLLEEDFGGELAFNGGELLVGFDDRLNARNTEETYSALEPELKSLGEALFGSAEVTIEQLGEPREPFRARLRCAEDIAMVTLRDRLA